MVRPASRYVCIHGHFYQPPRENPWLEAVEVQDSAYPYHDWNERITAECYGPNSSSRILDDRGEIVHVVNNYGRISFNVGPTLLAWMASAAPDTYEAVLDADRESQKRFSGHGSALAQAYNHVIMPLADERDRRTQVAWGVADFQHRFGRPPEGMWLPETAVDVPTLEVLAEHGIRFTILEPHQVRRVRRIGTAEWADVTPAEVDTTRAYRVSLPSGATIAVFLYDGPISRAVAFEGLLTDGRLLHGRLVGAFDPGADHPQLVHIATDGESYGHHHRHGDMALAFALHELEADPDVTLTNYGEFLERHPPTLEVEIAEATSWSCAHGVERWRADCGCSDGAHPEWGQAWRAPLRDALEWLRATLAPLYERRAAAFLADPWSARDDYVQVVLDRSPAVIEDFLARHATRPLDADERSTVWKLLELQRHALLMFTSCGWFFDDLARIETVQVLQYAGRAIELAEELSGRALEPAFLDRLARARSNDPDEGDGRQVYERHVRPVMADVRKVAADLAVRSLFEQSATAVRSYTAEQRPAFVLAAGDARLAAGRLDVRSTVTGESTTVEYAVLHLGDHNIDARVRDARDDARYEDLLADLRALFATADFPGTVQALERHFGSQRYSLSSLFRDEQRRILRVILDASIEDARATYRSIFRPRAPLMRYLTELGVRLPRTFHRAAEVVVNDDLRRAFADEDLDAAQVASLLEDARAWDVDLDAVGLAHALNTTIERLTQQVGRELPEPSLFHHFGAAELEFFRRATLLVELARSLPFEVDLWRAQNLFYDTLQRAYPELRDRAARGDEVAGAWVDGFRDLGAALGVSLDAGPF